MGFEFLYGINDAGLVPKLYKIVAPSEANVEKVYNGLIAASDEFQESIQHRLELIVIGRSCSV